MQSLRSTATTTWYHQAAIQRIVLVWLCCCFWGNVAGLVAGNIVSTPYVVLSTKSNGGHTRRYPIATTVVVPSESKVISADSSGSTSPSSETNVATLKSSDDSSPTKATTEGTPALLLRLRLQQCQAWMQRQRSLGVSVLRSTFLPVGYPLSVPANYLVYCRWSWIQDWSTSLRAVVATQRVLQGIGVGRTTATALSAVHAFLVRDAAGMVATLGLTSWASGKFAQNVKPWRLTADILVDIGISLEVAAVQMHTVWFVPMLCLGNMCKAMCGVCAGATGGPIALYWASRSGTSNTDATEATTSTDISDISAKFGAQHTVTASLGLLGAGLFAKSVATAPLSVVWIIYTALTILHIYANMQCLRTIAFAHLNTARYNLVVDSFWAQWNTGSRSSPSDFQTTSASTAPSASTDSNAAIALPTPKEISTQEPLFFWNPWSRRASESSSRNRTPITMGVSFNEFIEQSGKDPATLLPQSSGTRGSQLALPLPYLIAIGASGTKAKRNSILVALSSSNTNDSIVWSQAYFHAALLQQVVHVMRRTSTAASRHQPMTAMEIHVAETVARDEFPAAWTAFAQACRDAGWDLTKSTLENDGYEISTIVEEL